MEITAPLVGLIVQQSPQYSAVAQARQKEAKAAVRRRNLANNTKEADALTPKLTKVKQMAMEQSSEKGAGPSKHGATSTKVVSSEYKTL